MFEDDKGNLKRDLSEQEFLQWKESWLREKGCPFFACSQALYRKVCGSTLICGCLFDYKMYKEKPWIKVCDIELDKKENLPTASCAACCSSMSVKVARNDLVLGQSCCKYMNDIYEQKGLPVDRSNEKYIASWGVYLIPVIGEDAYLLIQNNPQLIENIMKEVKEKQ